MVLMPTDNLNVSGGGLVARLSTIFGPQIERFWVDFEPPNDHFWWPVGTGPGTED